MKSRWNGVVLALLLLLPAAFVRAQQPMVSAEVSGSGYPMILLPGLSSSGAVWDATVAHFGNRYECHVLSVAGFAGRPPVETDSFLVDVREAVAEYIRQNDLGQPIVVGHSLGGVVALWLAAVHPRLVGQLIIVDALPSLTAAYNPSASEREIRLYAEQAQAMTLAQPVELFRMAQPQIFASMITDSSTAAHAAEWGRGSDQHTVAQATYDLMTTDLREAISAIDKPTLVLAAGVGIGPGITTDRIEEIYLRQYEPLPQLRMVLMEHCRHFIMLDDPEWFFEEIEKFLGWIGE